VFLWVLSHSVFSVLNEFHRVFEEEDLQSGKLRPNITSGFEYHRIFNTQENSNVQGVENPWKSGVCEEDSDPRLSCKLISPVTAGTGRSPALNVGSNSLGPPTCWGTSVFIVGRRHSLVPSVGRDSLDHQGCNNTTEFTLGRDRSPAPSVGKDLLIHPLCWNTSKFPLTRDRLNAQTVGSAIKVPWT